MYSIDILGIMSKRLKVSHNYREAIDELLNNLFIRQCKHVECRNSNGGFDCVNTVGLYSCSSRSHNAFRTVSCSIFGCCENLLDEPSFLRNHITESHNNLLTDKILALDAIEIMGQKISDLETVIATSDIKFQNVSNLLSTRVIQLDALALKDEHILELEDIINLAEIKSNNLTDELSNRIVEYDAIITKDNEILKLNSIITAAEVKVNKLSERWRNRHSTEALRLDSIIDSTSVGCRVRTFDSK